MVDNSTICLDIADQSLLEATPFKTKSTNSSIERAVPLSPSVEDEIINRESHDTTSEFHKPVFCACKKQITHLTVDSYIGIKAHCQSCIKDKTQKIQLRDTLEKVKLLYGQEPFSVHLDCIDIDTRQRNLGRRKKMALDIQFKSIKNPGIEFSVLNVVIKGSAQKPVGDIITEIVHHLVKESLDMGINLIFGVCDLATEHMRFMISIKTGIVWIPDVLHALAIIRNHLADGKSLYLNGNKFTLEDTKHLRKGLTISGDVLEGIKELNVFFNKDGDLFKKCVDSTDVNFVQQKEFMACCYYLLNLSISEEYLDDSDLESLSSKLQLYGLLTFELNFFFTLFRRIKCVPGNEIRADGKSRL